ncbi:uncharacterized protein BKCO1_3000188 [Diplodia corticola]|uniref:Zn(2)-C6 fungal-type domain-containing protein n=1 Tax=Diplodia corticola TaxID=236234 RepID=A0A1J9S1N0_9PEZI|nr:uncharacterized protein BKCO1_3000188 [Diplodia corticola]OJD38851.1 hypothetical protein BKCO1_3000188 [Diplodia corticola]
MDLQDKESVPGLTLLSGNPNIASDEQSSKQPGEQQQTSQANTSTLDVVSEQRPSTTATLATGSQTTPTTEQQSIANLTASNQQQMSKTPKPGLQASRRSETPVTTEPHDTNAASSDTDVERLALLRRCLRCKSVKKGCTGGKPCAGCVKANLSAEECETDVEYGNHQRRRKSKGKTGTTTKRAKSPKKKSGAAGRATDGISGAATPASDINTTRAAQTTTATHDTTARTERIMAEDSLQPSSAAAAASSSSPSSSPSPGARLGPDAWYAHLLTKPAGDTMSPAEPGSSDAVQAAQAPDTTVAQMTTQAQLLALDTTSAAGHDSSMGTPVPGTGPQPSAALLPFARQSAMGPVTAPPVMSSQSELRSPNSEANQVSAAPTSKTPRKRNTTNSPAPRAPKEKKTPASKKKAEETGDSAEKKTKTPRKRAKKADPKGSGPNNATPVQGSSLRNEIFPSDGSNKDGDDAASTGQHPSATQSLGGAGQSLASSIPGLQGTFIPGLQSAGSLPRNPYLDNIKLNTTIAPGGTDPSSPSGFASQQQQTSITFPSYPYTSTVPVDKLTVAPGTSTYELPPDASRHSSERDNSNVQDTEMREQSDRMINPPPGVSSNFKSYFDVDMESSSKDDETPSHFATPKRSADVSAAFADAVREHQMTTVQIQPTFPSDRDTFTPTSANRENSEVDSISNEAEHLPDAAPTQTTSEQERSSSASAAGGHQDSGTIQHKRPRAASLSIALNTTSKRPRIDSEPAAGTAVDPSNTANTAATPATHVDETNSHTDSGANTQAQAQSTQIAQTAQAKLLTQIVSLGDRILRSSPGLFPTTRHLPIPEQQQTQQQHQPPQQHHHAPNPNPTPTPLTPHELRAIAAYPPGVSTATYARLTPREAEAAEMERYLVWYAATFGSGNGGRDVGGATAAAAVEAAYDAPPPGHVWARLRLDVGMPAVWRVGMRPPPGAGGGNGDGEWPVGGRQG